MHGDEQVFGSSCGGVVAVVRGLMLLRWASLGQGSGGCRAPMSLLNMLCVWVGIGVGWDSADPCVFGRVCVGFPSVSEGRSFCRSGRATTTSLGHLLGSRAIGSVLRSVWWRSLAH